jgi:hypothetical protein
MAMRTSERGSALVEAAIIFPCLVLILYWAAALTDVMVLKLKAAEALRYSLWETTVFKDPAAIDREVKEKFVDLRSPASIDVAYTGLLMYPLASDLAWRAAVDTTSQKVGLGGTARLPPGGTALDRFINLVLGALSRSVDTAAQRQGFNVFGKATARVTLVRARHDQQASPILKGGDLPGLRGGNDLAPPPSMANLTFQAPLPSERSMQLVFDTWKAWPKPAAYTRDGASTDVAVAPRKTYLVVEEQVSAQVNQIAFFGLNRQPWFQKLNDISGFLLRNGATRLLAGGHLPNVFSADRMDGKGFGPLTILPPERMDVPWAPSECDFHGASAQCPTQRLGDLRVDQAAPAFLDDMSTLGPRVDRTRYTLPYRINTQYWTSSGGTDVDARSTRLTSPRSQIAENNDYVRTYRCRGHYFAGSRRAQEPDPGQRYSRECYR